MLILTRKPGESLYIGDSIKITIVELKGHQIRVGIEAPKEMRIYREEIYLQILEENKKAAEAPVGIDIGLENLTAAWTKRQSGDGESEGGKGGEGDEDSGTGDPKAKTVGLSAFSTHKVDDKGRRAKPFGNLREGAPSSTPSAGSPIQAAPGAGKDPQIVVRRKRSKKADGDE